MASEQPTTFPFLHLAPELQQNVLDRHYEDIWFVNLDSKGVSINGLPTAPFLVSQQFALQAKQALAAMQRGIIFCMTDHVDSKPRFYDDGISVYVTDDFDSNFTPILQAQARFDYLAYIKLGAVQWKSDMMAQTRECFHTTELRKLLQGKGNSILEKAAKLDMDDACEIAKFVRDDITLDFSVCYHASFFPDVPEHTDNFWERKMFNPNVSVQFLLRKQECSVVGTFLQSGKGELLSDYETLFKVLQGEAEPDDLRWESQDEDPFASDSENSGLDTESDSSTDDEESESDEEEESQDEKDGGSVEVDAEVEKVQH